MIQGIKCVVQGADHIAKNLICQDAAAYKTTENYGIAVVADGHGSERHFRSDIGSKKAVQAAIETVDAFMEDYEHFTEAIHKDQDFVLRKMEEQFLARWTCAVEDYQDENPLTEEEAKKAARYQSGYTSVYTYYGSTVLIAVMARDYCYGMLIGDGGFVVIDETGEALIPIEDKASKANYTSSICSRNAMSAWECFFEDKQPLALCVSTDGLIKSFGNEEDFKEYHICIAAMLDNLERCQLSLDKNLHKRTTQGSGDDISISIVFEQQRIAEGLPLLKNKIEQHKAKREQEKLERQKAIEEQKRQKELQELKERENKQRKLQKMMEQKQNEEEALKRRIMEQNSQLTAVRQEQEDMRRRLVELEKKKTENEAETKQVREGIRKTGQRILKRAEDFGSSIRQSILEDDFFVLPSYVDDDIEDLDEEDILELLLDSSDEEGRE
jgi:hypothetical protein